MSSAYGTSTIGAPVPLLAVDRLSVRYGVSSNVLHEVSIDVMEGQVVCLLGANGAGKTTLLRAVTGLLDQHGGRVTSGTITFAGVSEAEVRPERAVKVGIAQVLEGRRLFADLSVRENLRIGSFTSPKVSDATRARIDTLFPRLRELEDRKSGFLSGGEQQMVAIGRALMSNPRLLILDEPSLGLAPKVVEQIRDAVEEIAAGGTSVLLVEQNAGMALSAADVAYLLANGSVVRHGSAADLRADAEVQRVYLGGSVEPPEAAPERTDASAPIGPSDKIAPPTAATARPIPVGNLVSFDNVTLAFGGVRALSGLTFDVPRGGVVAVIGPNGAGKTSLFNTLSGFHTPTSGRILFDGAPLPPRSKVPKAGIARTFQNLGLFNELTVEENILLGRHRAMSAGVFSAAFRLPRARREERQERYEAQALLERYDLSEYHGRLVGELPYGIRKQIELVKALAMNPRLLLLDEPVAGMNGAERDAMTEHLLAVIGDPDLTVMLVEHDMGFVMNLARKVVVLDFGTVIAQGTPEQVQSDPKVIEAYTGTAGSTSDEPDSHLIMQSDGR